MERQTDRVVRRDGSLLVDSVVDEGCDKNYRRLSLPTARGAIRTRFYEAPGARRGVVWVGGVSNRFDGPVGGLFADLASTLLLFGISSLRLSYRRPGEMEDSILDVRAGIGFLNALGISALGLVGHSFGGPVAIQAALMSGTVQTVVTLASQTCGADTVDQLSPKSLLLIHGEEDRILPPYCSASLYAKALEPKRILLLPGAGHTLQGARERVLREVSAWLRRWLGDESPSRLDPPRTPGVERCPEGDWRCGDPPPEARPKPAARWRCRSDSSPGGSAQP